MDPGEQVRYVIQAGDYKGFVLFFFENGKAAKVPLSAYETKTNRRKLTGAYSDKSPLVSVMAFSADEQVVLYSSDDRAMIISSALLMPKTTRNTQGVAVMGLHKKAVLKRVATLGESGIVNQSRYRCKNLPSKGSLIKEEDSPEKQISFEV
jgi:DNA gyrase subunit A